MKIVVSDFDGTLHFHQEGAVPVPPINIEAIDKWRAMGNIFCFCSGRDVRSLMDEVSRYKFSYDYVMCNNGGTIFDKDLNLIKSYPLNKIALVKVLNSSVAKDSWHLLFSAADKMAVVIQNKKSPLLQYFESPKYKGQNIIKKTTINKALEEIDSVQLSCGYEDDETAQKFLEEIEQNYQGIFSVHRNMNYLDVCDCNVSKAAAIEELINLNNWQDAEVFTIGDSQNDIPMLKKYKGFSLNSATVEAKQVASKLYDSVGEMLLDNL